jgi:hypothetical protein
VRLGPGEQDPQKAVQPAPIKGKPPLDETKKQTPSGLPKPKPLFDDPPQNPPGEPTQGKPPADEPKKNQPADPPKGKPLPVGTIAGKITKVSEDGKSFTLRVYGKSVQPRTNLNPYDIWNRQRDLANPRIDPLERQRRQANLMRSFVQVKDDHHDREILLAEDVKVRVPPRIEFDEKTGRPKPLAIKKDLRDPERNLPGVKGTVDDLGKDLWVAVTLSKTRDKPVRILATMVVVLGEGDEK